MIAWTRVTGFGVVGLATLRRGGEVERNAHDVGVFDVEQAGLRVEIVGLAAQAAPDHLFAQKLGAERADAEDVGHGVGVPAFGQHRHRNHATDLLAEPTGRPTVFITSRSSACSLMFRLRAAGAFAVRELALELLDLRPAASRKPLSSASPDSIWRESISSVRGRAGVRPCSS